jgi:hypothetical protein
MTAKTVGIGYRIQDYKYRLGGGGVGMIDFPTVEGLPKPKTALMWDTLIMLCQHGNEHMGWPEARPSVKRLARETLLSDKTVSTHLTYLEALGVISVVGRWVPLGGGNGKRLDTFERSRGNVQTIWRIHEDVLDSWVPPKNGYGVKQPEVGCGEPDPPENEYVVESDRPRNGFQSTPNSTPPPPRKEYVGTPSRTPLRTPPAKTDCVEKPDPRERTEEEFIEMALNYAADRVTKQFARTNSHGYRKSIWADIEALRPVAEHVYTNARYCGERLDYQTVGLYVTCKHLRQPFTTPIEWVN